MAQPQSRRTLRAWRPAFLTHPCFLIPDRTPGAFGGGGGVLQDPLQAALDRHAWFLLDLCTKSILLHLHNVHHWEPGTPVTNDKWDTDELRNSVLTLVKFFASEGLQPRGLHVSPCATSQTVTDPSSLSLNVGTTVRQRVTTHFQLAKDLNDAAALFLNDLLAFWSRKAVFDAVSGRGTHAQRLHRPVATDASVVAR